MKVDVIFTISETDNSINRGKPNSHISSRQKQTSWFTFRSKITAATLRIAELLYVTFHTPLQVSMTHYLDHGSKTTCGD